MTNDVIRTSSFGFLPLFSRDHFIKIKQHPRDGRPAFVSLRLRATPAAAPLGVEQFLEALPLLGRRAAREAEPERLVEESGVRPGKFIQQSGRERPGEFVELPVVQQRERLKRRVRPEATGAGAETVWRVEHRQGRVRRGAPEVGIDSPPIAVLARTGFPLTL